MGYSGSGACTRARRIAAVAALLLVGHAVPAPPARAEDNVVFNPATGHYYKFVAANTTWTQARDLAAAVGGYLASTGSQAELDWILQSSGITGGVDVWLGGTDSTTEGATEGNWKWISGDPWIFSAWNGGEPNNSGGEHWLEMYTGGVSAGKWNDVPLSHPNPGYVIEWDQNPNAPPPPVTPAAPTDLTAAWQFDGTIGLAWTDNATNEAEFEVERTSASDPWTRVGRPGANAVAFSDADLAPVTEYTYRVRAKNSVGVSDWSNEATAASGTYVPYPKAPSDLVVAAAGPDFIDLQWTDNSEGESGFEVHRRKGTAAFAFLSTAPVNATTFHDGNLSPDTAYDYRVRAVGTLQASSFAETSGATLANLLVASASGDLKDSAKFRKDSLRLTASWTPDPETSDGTADPVAEGIVFRIGAEDAPLSLQIPAGDPGWKGKGLKKKWKSPAGQVPKLSVKVDLEAGTLAMTVKSAELTAPGGTTVRVSLAIGDDAGTERREWEEVKPGYLRLR